MQLAFSLTAGVAGVCGWLGSSARRESWLCSGWLAMAGWLAPAS